MSSELCGQGFGLGRGAVPDDDLGARVAQRPDRGAAEPPAPRTSARLPCERLADRRDDPLRVGVVGGDRAASKLSVFAAPIARAAADAVSATASAASLCGTVTLTPAKPSPGSERDQGGEVLGRDLDRLVGPLARPARARPARRSASPASASGRPDGRARRGGASPAPVSTRSASRPAPRAPAGRRPAARWNCGLGGGEEVLVAGSRLDHEVEEVGLGRVRGRLDRGEARVPDRRRRQPGWVRVLYGGPVRARRLGQLLV